MFNDIAEKIAAVPNVSSVALTSSVTMDGMTSNDPIFAQDRTYSENQLPPLRRYKAHYSRRFSDDAQRSACRPRYHVGGHP